MIFEIPEIKSMHGLIAVFARWSFLWIALVSMAADRAPVRLITDWYPQPEHGGFYYALIKGYYREAGLDVEILPGGPNAFPIQRIATKAAEFGMGSTDDVLLANDRGIPIVAVAATLQHDPQETPTSENSDQAVHGFYFGDFENHFTAPSW